MSNSAFQKIEVQKVTQSALKWKIIPVEEFAVAEAVDETYRENYSLTKW